MAEEKIKDAESVSRHRNYSAQQHLEHLLKIGHKLDSVVVKNFITKYRSQLNLEALENEAI